MITKNFCLLITILFLSKLQSQSIKNRFHWELSGGMSLPISSFSSKSTDNDNSGFANTGFFIDLSGSYKFSKMFGAEILLSNQFFGTDFRNLASDFSKIYGSNTSLESGNYHVLNSFVGPFIEIQLNEKIKFKLKTLVGFNLANLPDIKMQFSNNNFVNMARTQSNNFAFQFGNNFYYAISKKLELSTTASFNYSNLYFNDVNRNTNNTIDIYEMDILYMVLNLGLGVKYNF
ncbi:MAG: hypothetical protein MUF43_05155 [Flavobacterium sp.]|nr:hypothetical protein [Flavobacterium sp.]